jgi:hypothetical protein
MRVEVILLVRTRNVEEIIFLLHFCALDSRGQDEKSFDL